MKKNKGFTIIEILAVIVLLALIMILVIPTIINFLETSKKESFYLYANSVYDKAVNRYVADENDASRTDINCSVYKIPNDLDISNSGDYQGWVKIERTAKSSGNYSLTMAVHNDNGLYSVKYCTKYNSDCDPENVSDTDPSYESDYWMVLDGSDGKAGKDTFINITKPENYHLCVQYQYPDSNGHMTKSSINCSYTAEQILSDTYEYKVTLTMRDRERAIENYIIQGKTDNEDENKKIKEKFFDAIDAYKTNHASEMKSMPLTELVCSGVGNVIGGNGENIITRPTQETSTTTTYITNHVSDPTSPQTTQVITHEDHTKQGSLLLTDLTITGYNIGFSPTHRDYSFTVPYSVTALNINYTKANSDVGVEVVGADNIVVGTNTIVVHAWNDSTSEEVFYYIKVTRVASSGGNKVVTTAPVRTTVPSSDSPDPTLASSNAKLINILVAGYELSDVFSPDTYAYDIEIDQFVNELSIDPILQEVTSRYEISGNHNLQEGSKIQITVISQNGFYHNTYTLTVHIKKKKNHSTTILRVAALGLVAVLIILLVMMKKQKNSELLVETNKAPEVKTGGVVQPTQINKK